LAQGKAGVDRGVGQRFSPGPVVGRLGGGVDHHRDVPAVTGEHIGKRALAADVGIDVTAAGQILSRLRRAGAVDAAAPKK